MPRCTLIGDNRSTHCHTGWWERILNNYLYSVVGNSTTGTEVWRTGNGTTWVQVGLGGFGDGKNNTSYWDNGATVFGNALYIGT